LLFNLFKINTSELINTIYSTNSPIANEKELNYSYIIDSIKTKKGDGKELDKYFSLDILAQKIKFEEDLTNEERLNNNNNNGNNIIPINDNKKENINNDNNIEDDKSEISFTPSLQSQDTGKSYKDMIILNEKSQKEKQPFYPIKTNKEILFYSNEHYYVIIRYLFCIHERLNKLNEYSMDNSNTGNNNIEDFLFKSFVIIYKALIHKKIENINTYEELCRDILSNESYFLFSFDKIINSVK
jgi:hypothetical protein